MDYKEQLKVIENFVQNQRLEEAKLKQQKKTLSENTQTLLDELMELGIKQEDSETWLEEKKTKIENKLKELQELLGI